MLKNLTVWETRVGTCHGHIDIPQLDRFHGLITAENFNVWSRVWNIWLTSIWQAAKKINEMNIQNIHNRRASRL